ncbi:unnamed protein product [Oppiella nova]|uniref:Uncharacterized protein n=1 Tax=Oppiella nova TaxID=334625 RepID=A0A7R9LPD2_9ACAR|nr:unnamed protein product [Oppiella nova]CAG2165650.1 unnamed protein product [Oppiella nova]
MGLIWFVPKAHKSLIYYPTLEALKLNKVQALDIACATNELIVLTDSGVIFRREGMDATKPVGTKWMLIKNNKSKSRITSVSVHTKESILWCCDTNGETWTHTMRPHKWSLINDYNSHSIEMRKVCVSVTDWTVVWGIDRSGKIFVRTFNKSVDQKQDFRGDEWLLMDGILATDIALYDHTVIIAVEGNQLFRRSAKIRQSDSSNEWQPVVVPDIPPEDSVTSVSVTENNDIWIMTATGLVWHTINQLDRHSVKEESDWLII